MNLSAYAHQVGVSYRTAWRWFKAGKVAGYQLGYVRDKLKFKLEERGVRYRSVQPAYSSQQCSQCGFTLSMNRRSRAEFHCLWCGYEANADENAAANIAERFSDKELNLLSFRAVETTLAIRFMRRLPDARSASAGLELHILWDGPRR